MIDVNSWDGANRQFVTPSVAGGSSLEVSIIEEDLGCRPAWTFKAASYHTLFIQLSDELPAIGETFEDDAETTHSASVGGVWMIPAGHPLENRPQAGRVRFCEIRLPAHGVDFESVEITLQSDIRDGFLYEAAQVFQCEAGKDDQARMSSRHLVEAVKWHIIDRYDLNQAHRASSSKTLARSTQEYIMSYINDMIRTKITLEDLARVTTLDVHVFLKKFYASFGTTPGQYIAGVRIDRAKTLLTSSSLPVGEIALLAGFNSASHFCVSFVKHVGIAPMAFRQARR
jgi:AraC family transcriptional regulator